MLAIAALFLLIVNVLVVASKEDTQNLSVSTKTFRVPPASANVNSTVNSKSNGWVYFNQCDPSWANQRLGWCDDYTLCTGGCAMTSTAMILATKGVSINPSSLDDWLSNNGGYANGCDLIWSRIDAFGVTSFQGLEYADEGAICNGLSQGHGIVANVNNGEHWVLLTGCAGGGVFYVNDPAFSRTTYSMGEILMEAVYH